MIFSTKLSLHPKQTEEMKYSPWRTKSGCPRGDNDMIYLESAIAQTSLPEVRGANHTSLRRLEEADIVDCSVRRLR